MNIVLFESFKSTLRKLIMKMFVFALVILFIMWTQINFGSSNSNIFISELSSTSQLSTMFRFGIHLSHGLLQVASFRVFRFSKKKFSLSVWTNINFGSYPTIRYTSEVSSSSQPSTMFRFGIQLSPGLLQVASFRVFQFSNKNFSLSMWT